MVIKVTYTKNINKGGFRMYFSLFDKLRKNEISHSEMQQIQEELKEIVCSQIETDDNKKSQA